MIIDDRIKSLNIVIPKAPKPVGSYTAYTQSGNLIFISGQISINSEGKITKGKVGKDLNLTQAQDAAFLCGINIISQIRAACKNDLNKVKKCVKITGYVNSSDDFIDQPKVINSASELLKKVFDQAGIHSRAAVSVNSLPLGAAVEIDAIFELN